MAKKIALLISLVMIFSFSLVLATESVSNTNEVSGEAELNVEEPTSDEQEPVSGEAVDGSGEELGEDISSGELDATPDEQEPPTITDDIPDDATEEGGNSTIIGAIIAIIVVVAIVAIVYIIQKK